MEHVVTTVMSRCRPARSRLRQSFDCSRRPTRCDDDACRALSSFDRCCACRLGHEDDGRVRIDPSTALTTRATLERATAERVETRRSSTPPTRRCEIATGTRRIAGRHLHPRYLKTHNYHWNVTGPMFHTPAPHVRDAVQRARPRRRSRSPNASAPRRSRTGRATASSLGTPRSSKRTTDRTRPR